MIKNGIETMYHEGRHWETIKNAAARYGVKAEVVSEQIGKDLFWADDPRTGIRMVCGALGKRREEHRFSFWDVVKYLLCCPTNRILPNLLWLAVWGTVVVFTANVVDGKGGLLLAVVLGIVKFVYAVKWEKEHPQEVKPVVYVDDGCCGCGDGFFDEVSTRRRSDIQFLMGTGPFAR